MQSQGEFREMTYSAIVAKVDYIRPIEGADRICIASIRGSNVITSVLCQVGDIGILFPSDGQLSEEYCQVNDLLRRKETYIDPTDGITKTRNAGGYVELNRRVRAIIMKGVRSEAMFMPLDSVSYTGVNSSILVDGFEFTELNDHEICRKYVSAATARAMSQQARTIKRGETEMFRKMTDIDQFGHRANEITAGSLIHITAKLHGTSQRYGHVLDDVIYEIEPEVSFFNKIGHFIMGTKPDRVSETRSEWRYLNGTKNVILESESAREITSWYGTDEFRQKAVDGISLAKGETLYFEVIGWYGSHQDQTIMNKHNTDSVKALKGKYPNPMIYSYGATEGTADIYVYRITMTSPDGKTVEYPWHQVVKRCRELGLNHVPHIESFIYDGNIRDLAEKVDRIVNGDSGVESYPSVLDTRHIEEGIVVRAESDFGTIFLKHKNINFKIAEGIMKEADDIVDMEESS